MYEHCRSPSDHSVEIIRPISFRLGWSAPAGADGEVLFRHACAMNLEGIVEADRHPLPVRAVPRLAENQVPGVPEAKPRSGNRLEADRYGIQVRHTTLPHSIKPSQVLSRHGQNSRSSSCA